jgi:hypothetical protein
MLPQRRTVDNRSATNSIDMRLIKAMYFFYYEIIRHTKSFSHRSSYTQVFSQSVSTTSPIIRSNFVWKARLSKCFSPVLSNGDEGGLQGVAGIISTLNTNHIMKKHGTNGTVWLLFATYSLQSRIILTYRDFIQVSPREYLCINSNRARPPPSKSKAVPLQAWAGPEGSRRLRHMKVVRLSAIRTGRLYPPGSIPGTHFC